MQQHLDRLDHEFANLERLRQELEEKKAHLEQQSDASYHYFLGFG